MKTLYLSLVLSITGSFAYAQDPVLLGDEVTATWDHPTEYVDNTALPIEEILNTAIFSAEDPLNVDLGNMQIVEAPTNTVVLDPLTEGTWYIGARTYATNGEFSDLSNVVVVDVVAPLPVPQPPVNFTLTADSGTVASTITQTRDRIALVPVGTVIGDVACDGSYSVNGQFVVPYDQIEWYGSVRSEVVVAPCSPG